MAKSFLVTEQNINSTLLFYAFLISDYLSVQCENLNKLYLILLLLVTDSRLPKSLNFIGK